MQRLSFKNHHAQAQPSTAVPGVPLGPLRLTGMKKNTEAQSHPFPNPIRSLHHLRRPKQTTFSLGSTLEGRAAGLSCLGSTCQVAGPCPNRSWVPSFTARAGSTPSPGNRLWRPEHSTRERGGEKGPGVGSERRRALLLLSPPNSPPRGLSPRGLNGSRAPGPEADGGSEIWARGRNGEGQARRGAAEGRGRRAGGGRREEGLLRTLAALGARLCRARCTRAGAGTWNGARVPAQPPR